MLKSKKIFSFLKWASLVVFLVLMQQFFWPRQYKAPARDSSVNNHFWKLSTGSVLGYTKVVARAEKQPYPIVYLHGGPGGAISSRITSDFSFLSELGFEMYFYDQVGSGASNRLTDIGQYTLERHVRDLKEVIDSIGSPQVILLGQSWGAILASAFVAQYPDKVSRLILTSPGPIYPIHQEKIAIKAPDSLQLKKPLVTNAKQNASVNNLRMRAITFFATKLGIKLASDAEVDVFAAYSATKTNLSALCDTSVQLKVFGGVGFYAELMTYSNLLTIKDYRSAIRGLKIPTLVLKGQCDNQPWGATLEYLELFPNHKFVLIPGAGHFLAVEQAVLFERCISDFLADLRLSVS